MKIRKSGIAAAVATLAVGALFAASTPAIADTPTLLVWYPSDKKADYVDLVNGWASQNGVQVTLVGKDFGQVRDILKTAVPAGTGPDILLGAAHDWTGNLVASGVVRPINLSAAVRSGLTKASLAAFNLNGKQYGVPAYTESLGFFRNIKVAPKPVTNLNQIKNGELAVPYGTVGGDGYHFYPLQTAFGAPVFKHNAKGWTSTLAMDNAGGKAFAKFLAKGVNFFGAGGYNQVCDFVNGKIKYLITGPWNVNNIVQGSASCKTGLAFGTGFKVESFPKGPGGQGVPFLGAKGAFLTNSPNTDVVHSMALLNYLSGTLAGKTYYKAEHATPANTTALAIASSDPVIKAFAAIAKNANVLPMPNVVAMDSVWDKWGKTEAKILGGKSTSPVGDWTAMTSAITALIKG